jgi:hypothetical protein
MSAVGVGFLEVGEETRQQLDGVGGVEKVVEECPYLNGFLFQNFCD